MKTGANEWGEEKKGRGGRGGRPFGGGEGDRRPKKKWERGGGREDVAAVGIGNGPSPLSPFAWPAEIKPV